MGGARSPTVAAKPAQYTGEKAALTDLPPLSQKNYRPPRDEEPVTMSQGRSI